MLRIKLNLKTDPGKKLPLNYNYGIYLALRSIVLKELQAKKPKLYKAYQQNFPEFTFSYLRIPQREIKEGFIYIKGTYLALFVSSVDDFFIQQLIAALEREKKFSFLQQDFAVLKVEIVAEPEWREKMEFTMLSPLLVIRKNKKKVKFLLATSLELEAALRENLLARYQKLFPGEKTNFDFRFYLNQDFLMSSADVHKLITIRNIHYKTIYAPFFLEGNSELIRFAYYAGIGDKTSYGLGMFTPK